ncbi:hypothetical protein [Nonomuraea endophytica]|uniref:Uncharacterized protein n=1 Tax=Nonomuraea endophytica TaxID=714136 RepID=A0A7W8EKA7_9ACTN|nr:hypothetical protein [Nonomuraea endophytica]MBB5084040.1 hypothetical protein [Nonomuraea endophytica]
MTLILLILALVCFVLAALNVAAPRINLLALGLALWILTEIIPKISDM